jgi:hypothetical protein
MGAEGVRVRMLVGRAAGSARFTELRFYTIK